MSNDQIRLLVHFSWALGHSTKEIHSQLESVHGKGICSVQTVRKWVKKFKKGELEIGDRPRAGRPSRSDIIPKVQQLLQDFPFLSSHALAKELGEDRRTISRVLKNSLGLMKLSLRWVPHELTPKLMEKRSNGASDLFHTLSSLSHIQQNHVVTGDQTWVFLRNEQTQIWGKRNNTTPVRVKRTQGEYKIMLTVLFSKKEILLVDFLPEGQKFNSTHMTSVILPALETKIKTTCPKKGVQGWFIHLDNARPHNSRKTSKWISDTGMTRLPHPPYSPDLAPSDFALFGYLKTHLRTVECNDPTDLRREVTKFLMTLPSNWFQLVWDKWLERLQWVHENHGIYFTK